jgi:nucleotide-binding universal stress UspA family protein
MMSRMLVEAIIENSRRHYEKVLKPIQARVAATPIKAHFEILVGDPAEQIVRYAEKHGIDHIVVGCRGHTLFERRASRWRARSSSCSFSPTGRARLRRSPARACCS